MKAYPSKTQSNITGLTVSNTKTGTKAQPAAGWADHRGEAAQASEWQDLADNSPRLKQAAQLQQMAKAAAPPPVSKSANKFTSNTSRGNHTELSDQLKGGIYAQSGLSINPEVHLNSSKPAELNAHAYAQGNSIYVASGQEKHIPHEAWHVVQQMQGRVKSTMQLKGVDINDNDELELEADKMGRKASQLNELIPGDAPKREIKLSRSSKVSQLKKENAEKYVTKHSLAITDVSHKNVKEYINDAGKPKESRRGLLQAWNRGLKNKYRIQLPGDLKPVEVEMDELDDFEIWNSEDEDDLNLKEVIDKKRKRGVTLVRANKTGYEVPLLGLNDAIRIGRQVVKRDCYDLLPFVVEVGPCFLEYNNPGTKDIYATPLIEIEKGKKYQRAGQASDYSFSKLTVALEEELTEEDEPARKKRRIESLETVFDTFSGKAVGAISPAKAEVIGAISCDFMKGSGAFEFVSKAKERANEAELDNYQSVFTGPNPFYTPSETGGRGKVVRITKLKHAHSSRENLVDAIAKAARNNYSTFEEFLAIHDKIGSRDETLEETPITIKTIIEKLKVEGNVVIHYQKNLTKEDKKINLNFERNIHIYHIKDNSFKHECPDPAMYNT